MYDELDLDMLGDERTALFLIMSDTDGTFAFLISLIYSICLTACVSGRMMYMVEGFPSMCVV